MSENYDLQDPIHWSENIFLRPFVENDITDEYISWFQDYKVTRFLEARNISRDDARNHLLSGQGGKVFDLFAIIDVDTGTHIGNVKLGPINQKHNLSECSTVIGRSDFWGKGYATAAIREVISYAFDKRKIRKISATILIGNSGSLHAYLKAGFTVDAILKDHYLLEGKPTDVIKVACFNPTPSNHQRAEENVRS